MAIWHVPILRAIVIAAAVYFTAGAAMAYFGAAGAAGGTAGAFAAGSTSAGALSGTAMYTGAAAGAAAGGSAAASAAVASYATIGATAASTAAAANVASVVAATSVGTAVSAGTATAAASLASDAMSTSGGSVSSTAASSSFSDASMYGPIMPAAGGATTAEATPLAASTVVGTAAPEAAAASNVAGYAAAGGGAAADASALMGTADTASIMGGTPSADTQGAHTDTSQNPDGSPKGIFQRGEDFIKSKLHIGTPTAAQYDNNGNLIAGTPGVAPAVAPVGSSMSPFEKIMLLKSGIDMVSGYLKPTSQQQYSGVGPDGQGYHLGMHSTNGGFGLAPGGSETAPAGVPSALLPNQPGSAAQYSSLSNAGLAGNSPGLQQMGNLGQTAANASGVGGLVPQGHVNYMGMG